MIKRILKFMFAFGLLAGALVLVLSIHFYLFLKEPLKVPESGHVLMIPQGASVHSIAFQLSHEKVLDAPLWFMFSIGIEGAWSQIKAGEYLIKAGTTPLELIQQLKEGRVIQHALTIVPGWTFARLMQEINECPTLDHTLAGISDAEIMAKLGHQGEHPEGQFFPETYHFNRGTTDLVFLQRAHSLLQQKLASAWGQKSQELPIKSAYEALILASIIEKESSIPEEYGDIAAVFLKRLAVNMPLQADPTVIYGVKDSYKGVITKDMLAKASPYNTYQKLGLPPTPIALPSERALLAAIRPNAGAYLYFVAKKEGKGHVFSETYEAHQAAVNEYRAANLGKP